MRYDAFRPRSLLWPRSTPTTPTVSIAAASETNTVEGYTATFTVTANPAPSADLSMTYTVTPTGDDAAEPADFGEDSALDAFPTSTVTIMANQTLATIRVPIYEDSLNEERESYTVTIRFTSSATIGTRTYTIGTASANGSIVGRTVAPADNVDCTEDLALNNFCVDGVADVSEGQRVTFIVRLKGMTRFGLDVRYTISATSSAVDVDAEAADFADSEQRAALSRYPTAVVTIPGSRTEINPSVEVVVPTFNDAISEGAEAFTFTITPPVGSPGDSFDTTIAASDPITVVLDRTSTSSEFAGSAVAFRVSLTNGGDLSNLLTSAAPITIPYTIERAAAALLPDTATRTGRMMIASGSTQATISIPTKQIEFPDAPFNGSPPTAQPLTVTLGTTISTPTGNATVSGGGSSTANMIPYQIVPSAALSRGHSDNISWITSEFATVNMGENFMETEVTEGKTITLLGRLTNSFPTRVSQIACSFHTQSGTLRSRIPPPWTRTYSSDSSPGVPASRSDTTFAASTTTRSAANPSSTSFANHIDWYVSPHPEPLTPLPILPIVTPWLVSSFGRVDLLQLRYSFMPVSTTTAALRRASVTIVNTWIFPSSQTDVQLIQEALVTCQIRLIMLLMVRVR